MGGGASVFRRGGEKEANLSNRGEIANKDGLNPEETTHTSIERDLSEKVGRKGYCRPMLELREIPSCGIAECRQCS